MPKRYKSRLYDEDESQGKIYLDGFPNARISSTICFFKDTNNEMSSLELGKKSIKRRKVSGLNDQIDRMLLRANTSFVASTDPRTFSHRKRVPSGSSSSTLSVECPKTPLDKIVEAERRSRIGKSLSPVKLAQQKKLRKRSPSPVPPWLSDTIMTLEQNHPLRMLTAPFAALDNAYSVPSNGLLDTNYHHDQNNIDADDYVFAFNAPSTPPMYCKDLTKYAFISSSRAEPDSYYRASNGSFSAQLTMEQPTVSSPGTSSFDNSQYKHQTFLTDPLLPEAATLLSQYDLDLQRHSNNQIIDHNRRLGTPLNSRTSRPHFSLDVALDDGESTLLDAEINSPDMNSCIHSQGIAKNVLTEKYISHYFTLSESSSNNSDCPPLSPARTAMHSPIFTQPQNFSYSFPIEEPDNQDFLESSSYLVDIPKTNNTMDRRTMTNHKIDEFEVESPTRNPAEQRYVYIAELPSSDDVQSNCEIVDGHPGYPRDHNDSRNISCAYNKIAFTPSSDIYISPLRPMAAEDSDHNSNEDFKTIHERFNPDNEYEYNVTELDESGKLTNEKILLSQYSDDTILSWTNEKNYFK